MDQKYVMNVPLILLAHTRFTGEIIKLKRNGGLVRLDNYKDLTAWIHPEAAVSQYEWNHLTIGTRIRFGLQESLNHPGTLVAESICRELPPIKHEGSNEKP